MLDQESYNQISRAFDEWENERLNQPNNGPQLTLDYDEVLSDLEKLSANETDSCDANQHNNPHSCPQLTLDYDEVLSDLEKLPASKEDSCDVNQYNNPQGANFYTWHINRGGVEVINAERHYSKTGQMILNQNNNPPDSKTGQMILNQNNNPPGANFYSWEKNSDTVRVVRGEEGYATNKLVFGVKKQSKTKGSHGVSQGAGHQEGNLYFFDMNPEQVREASAKSRNPKMKQSNKNSKRQESTPALQMTTGTDLDRDQNKKNTVTGSSSHLFEQKSIHLSDNLNAKKPGADFPPSM